MVKQRTLKRTVQTSGIGLHTGKNIEIAFHPAAINTGVVFRRVDLQPVIEIPARTDFVGDTRLNTCLKSGDAMISTVEHVLAAFAGLGIDNVYVDLQAPELPVMDGSAEPFVALIQSAGIVEQNADKQFLRIKHKIEVVDGDKWVKLEPFDGLQFAIAIDFDHPAIRATPQMLTFDFGKTSFISELSRARTFGFLADYDYLRQNNLGLGASLENTIVLDQKEVVNTGGLRYPDEFVKHKLLDAFGDLHLLGHNLMGAFSGYKSGHLLNHRLRQALLADKNATEIVTLNSTQSLPLAILK